MRLYNTSPHELAGNAPFPVCTSTICRFSGFTRPHVCFASQPLSGQGEWVHTIETGSLDFERFAFRNLFRREHVEHFAVPKDIVDGLPRKTEAFEDTTGRRWDRWAEELWNQSTMSEDKSEDRWALLWMSRNGAAGASVLKKFRSPAGERLVVGAELAQDFDPGHDYLIIEHHEFVETRYGWKDKWSLELLAGVMPDWGVFGWAWAEWVFDEEVVDSAVAHILAVAPGLKRDVEYARDHKNKVSRTRVWRIVADEVGRRLGRDLGRLDAKSWTAVQAMPIRIADRIGGWMPPKPRPQFQHPDKSGRVLLASPEGPHPRRRYSYEEGTTPRGMLDPD